MSRVILCRSSSSVHLLFQNFEGLPHFPFRNSCFNEFFQVMFFHIACRRGMQWRSWLRHCVTSRKVAGSFSDGVTGLLIALILPGLPWPWVDSASNRSEY